MKRIVVWAVVVTTLLVACHRRTETGQGVAVREPDEAPQRADAAAAHRVYVEAVLLLVPREEVKTLPPVTAELASRTDGTVVSASRVVLEAGHPDELDARGDSGETGSFTWHLDTDVLDDATIRLGIGVVRNEPDEEATTTLVLNDGQVAILPTLFSAPPGKVLVLVLKPRIIRSDEDLERVPATWPPAPRSSRGGSAAAAAAGRG